MVTSLFSYKRVSVTVLFDGTGKFLILKNARGPFKGFWGIPGGKANAFESSRKAALREAFEETGICLDEDAYRYRHSYYVDHSPTHRFKISVYEHSFESRPKVILDPNEHLEYEWVGLDEMRQYRFMPGGDKVLRQLYSKGLR